MAGIQQAWIVDPGPLGLEHICGNPMDFLSHPAFWICVAAASELIALSPLKSNGIVQLVFQVLSVLKGKKA